MPTDFVCCFLLLPAVLIARALLLARVFNDAMDDELLLNAGCG